MKHRIDSSEQRRQNMGFDKADNNLEEFNRQVQSRWDALSREQVSRIAGRRELLLEELQVAYDLSPDEAQEELDRFESGKTTRIASGSGRGETERAREFGPGNQPTDGSGLHRNHHGVE